MCGTGTGKYDAKSGTIVGYVVYVVMVMVMMEMGYYYDK